MKLNWNFLGGWAQAQRHKIVVLIYWACTVHIIQYASIVTVKYGQVVENNRKIPITDA